MKQTPHRGMWHIVGELGCSAAPHHGSQGSSRVRRLVGEFARGAHLQGPAHPRASPSTAASSAGVDLGEKQGKERENGSEEGRR
jgi:hypothetical protein